MDITLNFSVSSQTELINALLVTEVFQVCLSWLCESSAFILFLWKNGMCFVPLATHIEHWRNFLLG